MTKIKPGCWVMVVWHDAADEKQTWMRDEEIDEAVVEVISVGYLRSEERRVGKECRL